MRLKKNEVIIKNKMRPRSHRPHVDNPQGINYNLERVREISFWGA